MKEIVEAVSTRIKSPYFGYSILAFFALNWRGIFLLVVTEGTPQARLAAFDCVTSELTLVVFPLLIGALVAALNHWIRYLFGWISRKPLELIDNLSLEAEHKKTIRQSELEQSRSDLFSVKEKELIARAKRDEEVAEIEDVDAKEKLAAQLNALRRERDQLSEQLKSQSSMGHPSAISLSKEAVEILKAAAKNKSGTILKSKAIGGANIQASGASFGKESSRDYAKYEKALDDLIAFGFVKEVGVKGEVFHLTHEGWEAADAL
jgi:hypothetical protein